VAATQARPGVLIHDTASGAPLAGIPLVAVAEYEPLRTALEESPDETPPKRVAGPRVSLGMLASDHAGYLSFSLRPLGLQEAQMVSDLKVKNRAGALVDHAA
jgi:hypothetical protein